jgi:hypothetical protein
MLKKFFRKVRETVKKIAPIAAPIAGMYLGPGWGAGIGALLGQYGGTKGALQAGLLGGLGGLAGNYGRGFTGTELLTKPGMFGQTAARRVPMQQVLKNLAVGQKGTPDFAGRPSLLGKAWDFASSPKGMMTAAGLAGLLAANKDKDDVDFEEIEVGSQGQLGNLQRPNLAFLPPVSPHVGFDPGYFPGYADGGIVGLEKGGTPPKNVDDYPRKNGIIEGAGTMTSDSIPAMLSDGEFVTKALGVLGAGVQKGATTKEDARKKGSEFFYQQQENLAKLGEQIVNG